VNESPPAAAHQTLSVVAAFYYTIDDLREGLAPPPQQKRQKRPLHRMAFGWALFVSLTIMLLVLLQQNRRLPSAAAPPAPVPPPHAVQTIDLKYILIPSSAAALCFVVFIIALVMSVRMNGSMKQNVRDRSGIPLLAAILLCVLLLLGGSILVDSKFLSIEVDPSNASLNLLAIAPWIASVLISMVLVSLLRGKALQRRWNSKPSYRRRRTIALDDEGLRNSEEMGETFHKWAYFKRAWETKNELVLVDETDLRHILPKRAFEEVDRLHAAKAIISNHIAKTKFLEQPSAFPVRVVPLPPPIPRGNG
jgi:hypothetical protein